MAFSNFRVLVALQVALIVALGAVFLWLVMTTDLRMSTAIVAFALALAVFGLIRYVESTNRKLTRFLLAVRHADYSQTFSGGSQGRPFDELAATMNSALERFRETRSDREEQAIFLRTLVRQLPVALVSIRAGGEVVLFNNAASRLLGVSDPRRIQECRLLGDRFVQAVLALEPGRQEMLSASRRGEPLQLSLSATQLRQRGRDEKLVCMLDISSELEIRELSAVQKLMRVLTHEVMNSITPITSLAETAARDVSALEKELGSREELGDILAAIQTIGRRGSGLTRFVNSYRQMTRIPEPEISICSVIQVLERTRQLMRDDAIERGARIKIGVHPDSLEISADPELIEQALINLVRNALEAVEGENEPVVELSARMDRVGQVVIAVADNGPGLTEDARRNLFVPFFTTKKDGSGVGMSVVRQIMRLHRGTVGVESEPNAGTVVSLRF